MNENLFTGTINIVVKHFLTDSVSKDLIVKINPHTISYYVWDYSVSVGERRSYTLSFASVPHISLVKRISMYLNVENYLALRFNDNLWIYNGAQTGVYWGSHRFMGTVTYTPGDLGKEQFEYSDYFLIQSIEEDGRTGGIQVNATFYYE